MRRIILWLASTVTVVVLLFGYHTSSGSTTASTRPPSVSTSPSKASTTGSTTSPSTSSRQSSSATPSAAAKTYTGSVAQTRWGPVQVEITVAAGKVTKVNVVESPSGNPKDAEINDYALPLLVKDTLSAQSAKIDMVSGATVTSTGYVQSLQAALDSAGL
jgi:uncharacterized protein with FMN-binding domain